MLDQTAKGEKVLADPNSPKFLEGHVNKLKGLWVESNKCADERMAMLKGEEDEKGLSCSDFAVVIVAAVVVK